jgi:hypothetical protein
MPRILGLPARRLHRRPRRQLRRLLWGARSFRTEHISRLGVSRVHARGGQKVRAFLKRFLMHYGICRRYPLGLLPALRNAWRTARA